MVCANVRTTEILELSVERCRVQGLRFWGRLTDLNPNTVAGSQDGGGGFRSSDSVMCTQCIGIVVVLALMQYMVQLGKGTSSSVQTVLCPASAAERTTF